MASQTIREVLIKVAIEQKESTLRVPAVEQITKNVVQAGEKQKAVTKEVGEYRVRFGDRVEAYELQSTAKVDAAKSAAKFKEISIAEKVAAFRRGKADEITEAERKAAERATKGMEKFGRGAVEAAGGVAQIGRGLLLLGASSSNVEKLVKQLVGIQAGFDIASGGVKVYKGLNESLEGLAKRSGPEAALALSRVGAAAIAVAAVVGIGDQAFDIFGRHAEADRRRRTVGSAAALKGREAGQTERGRRLGERFATEDADDTAARRSDEIRARRTHASDIAVEAASRARTEKRLAEARVFAAKEVEAIQIPEKAREKLLIERRKLDSKRTGLPLGRSGSDERESITRRIAEIDRELNQKVKVSAEQRANAEKRVADLTQQRLGSLTREGDLLQRNLEIRNREVDAARSAVETEKDRIDRAQRELGRLNEAEFNHAQRLAKRIQSGAATQEEIDEARRLAPTLAEDAAAELERERGRRRIEQGSVAFTGRPATGSGSTLEEFQGDVAVATAGSTNELRNIENRIKENQAAQEAAAKDVETAVAKAGEAALTLMEKFIVQINLLTRKIEETEGNR